MKLCIHQIKKRYKNPFLFYGGTREGLDVNRSGQGLFLPHAKGKQKEKMSVGYFLFCIAGI
ncbi:hypothetical protein CAB88_30855 (plasmid) [Bacillus thuringiensis]|uniref:Uncharacterized protein n=1 Tax=Bacillus thuringiensis TaxID=1428 RepID=A0A1W6WXX1_BACTU|nr:hypothetical protein H175_328p034 [Bacillus thuringiensis serovar thuringiensis str. IS5056]ARP61410.1 hypothetical protein CAB88_30855 [Bacillus thuringiensis]AST05037.1 hypothetical protein BT10792_30920 [Bacillus thuringiensis]OTW37609.1 hypothetical protein BK698_31380 [Bacillus thuringiensis serovar thuringiensis]